MVDFENNPTYGYVHTQNQKYRIMIYLIWAFYCVYISQDSIWICHLKIIRGLLSIKEVWGFVIVLWECACVDWKKKNPTTTNMIEIDLIFRGSNNYVGLDAFISFFCQSKII